MPEVKDNGISLTFILRYGQRSIFSEWKGGAQPEDKPILPGEKVILKIPDSQADGWDKASQIEKRVQPKKLPVIFQELNFGDGTGFWGTSGAKWPVNKGPSQAPSYVSTNRVAGPNLLTSIGDRHRVRVNSRLSAAHINGCPRQSASVSFEEVEES